LLGRFGRETRNQRDTKAAPLAASVRIGISFDLSRRLVRAAGGFFRMLNPGVMTGGEA
jgi:hypothetical protein